jgi:ArsR family transcriptional regulator
MVLHHVPEPEQLIDLACEQLADDGRLIITELCEHDQDWVRDACGDAWLGFPAEDLLHWTRRAGVLPVSADYLALRNGFRVQIHEFQKPAAAPRGTTR